MKERYSGKVAANHQQLCDGYNRKYGTKYKGLKELLKALYATHDNCYVIADILGYQASNIFTWMLNFGLPLSKKRGCGPVPKVLAKIQAIPEKERMKMSTDRIAARIGHDPSYVRMLCKAHGLAKTSPPRAFKPKIKVDDVKDGKDGKGGKEKPKWTPPPRLFGRENRA